MLRHLRLVEGIANKHPLDFPSTGKRDVRNPKTSGYSGGYEERDAANFTSLKCIVAA